MVQKNARTGHWCHVGEDAVEVLLRCLAREVGDKERLLADGLRGLVCLELGVLVCLALQAWRRAYTTLGRRRLRLLVDLIE